MCKNIISTLILIDQAIRNFITCCTGNITQVMPYFILPV